jgi:hypothetical protein
MRLFATHMEDCVAYKERLVAEVSHVVRRVPGKVHYLNVEISQSESLVVFPQSVKCTFQARQLDPVNRCKPLLNLLDPLANPDGDMAPEPAF